MNAHAPSDAATAQLFHVDQLYRTLRTAIKWGCITWVGITAFGTIGEFAGKSTEVEVALSFLLNAFVKAQFLFTISLTGLAAAWAVLERTLRHKTVERLQGRIKELETKLDPHRSSSRLAPTGKTNPVDLGE